MGGKPRKKPAPPPFEPVEQAMKESCLWITVGSKTARDFARRVAELTLLEAAKIAEERKAWASPYDWGHDGVQAWECGIDAAIRQLESKAEELK